MSGLHERPPQTGIRYTAATDPSAGGADSFTLAISHKDGQTVILDAIRERKSPFSAEEVVAEFSDLLNSYGIVSVTGDNFAKAWPQQAFKRNGIDYIVENRPRSEIYQAALPLITSRRCELLDHSRMINQWVGLERRVGPSGRDQINHADRAHDDICNAVALSLVLANSAAAPLSFNAPFVFSVPRGQLGNLDPAGYSSAKPGGWPAGSPQAGGGPIHWTPPGGWRW